MRELLGAYVLDQLDDRERSSVQAHLDGCADCRGEVAELAPLVPALRSIDLTRLDRLGSPPSPPPELGEQIVAEIGAQHHRQARRRRSRTVLRRGAAGLVAAAALVGVFFLGGRLLTPDGPATPAVIAMDVRQVSTGVSAQAGLVRHTWGTEVQLQATGLTSGGAYTVTFVRADGSRVPGGTFLGTGGNPLRCSLNAALPVESARQVLVTDAGGTLVIEADVR